MKIFVVDEGKCNGCHNCQIACKDEHCENDWSPYAKPQPNTGQFWIKVDEKTHGQTPKVKVEYISKLCNHCENAQCLTAAKDEAVYRREDGLIIFDPEKSVGQKAIAEACPYGAAYWNEELSIPQKCTGCAHLLDAGEIPHCVDLCVTGALRFGEYEDFADELDSAELNMPEYGPHVYYLNRPKLFISGDVWDPRNDECVQGAQVLLKSENGFELSDHTDTFGDFWFRGIDPGVYKVEINAEGYLPIQQAVQVCESMNLYDFPLKKI
jgi:Fe-S-cluster-containing dehydrogenase component